MTFRQIFISEDKRLRAGWRLVFFISIYFLFSITFTSLAFTLGYELNINAPVSLLGAQMINILAGFAAVYLARKSVDNRTVASLGFDRRKMAADLLAGFGIAAGLMALIFLVFILFGWTTVEGFIWETEPIAVWGSRSLIMLLTFVLVGVWEETFFRGYLFRNLESGLNTVWAISISSLVFALFHYTNPEGQGIAPMVGILAAGIFFAVAYTATRSLWLPIGLHIGFNFFENTVFGFPVSGLQMPGLLIQEVTGPPAWTGAAFGPEAGLVLFPALFLAALVVGLYTRGRRQPALLPDSSS